MSVQKMLFGSGSYPALRAAIDASAMRQKVIAENIANADVPGYQPKDVSFEDQLKRSNTSQKSLELAGDSPGHIKPAGSSIPRPEFVDAASPDPATGLERGDFDLERSMVEMNENKVRYHALVTLISGRLIGLKNVIQSR